MTKASNPPGDRGLLASVDIMKMTKIKSAICEKDANSTCENSDTVFARAKLGYCSDSSIAQAPEISRTICKQISFPLKMGRLIAGSFNDTTAQIG